MNSVPVNHTEETFEQTEQTAAAVELQTHVFIFARGNRALELADELVQDVDVHDAEHDQERRGDGRPDDAADAREGVELA